MSGYIERVRDGRKSPLVLKTKLIGLRSKHPALLVFFFEGSEDVGVYEEWIGRTGVELAYEPISGRGKEQVLGLRDLLTESAPELLTYVYFFVDADFDEVAEDDRTFTLDAYSIENLLCDVRSLQSILIDELHCAGDINDRAEAEQRFRKLASDFHDVTLPIGLRLFLARRLGIRVLEKPERISDVLEISLDRAQPLMNLDFAVRLEREPTNEELVELRQRFEQLHLARRQRGKYVLQSFRTWVKLLTEDRKSRSPSIFSRSEPNLPGEPHSFSLRRLASRGTLPTGLQSVLRRAASEAYRRTHEISSLHAGNGART